MRKFIREIFEHAIAIQIVHYGVPFLGAMLLTYWTKVNGLWPVPWPLAILAGLVCLTCLVVLSDKILKHKIGDYTETRIKFTQSQGNKYYYESPEIQNIYTWKQIFYRMQDPENKVLFHSDTFFFIFDKPITYGWPKINSFGHNFPLYNFYLTTNRGALLSVNSEITAPIFEIYFPPLKKEN